MSTHDWKDAVQRLHGHLDPNHHSSWDSYCNYHSYSSNEAHGSGVGQKELSPPSRRLYSNKPEDEDPDGEPLETLEEVAELERKKRRLREIEEQIIYKKASLALKTIGKFVKETTLLSDSCGERPATLKNRVKTILLQRHSPSFLSRAQSQKERMSTTSLQDCHPLQLRVKALMKQRHYGAHILPTNSEVPDATPPHPSQSVTPPAKEENGANKGFLRFLSVLNKGVDIEFLNRIVNDDREDLPFSEELLNMHPSQMDNDSRESRVLNIGSSLQSHNHTDSADRKTDSHSREQSLSERLSFPDAEEEKDRRGRSLSNSVVNCSGRSESPVAVKKKKKEEEENPRVGEQNEQLQNILKTLGLSLETQELSQLADRTQMRLYGKRHEGRQGTDTTAEQERCSHKDYRKLPPSSSSSSKLTARSFSPSPIHRRHFDGSHSGERDELQNDCEETQRHTDRAEIESKQISAYYHQYPQNQTFLHPASVVPDYGLSENSHYTDHISSYSSAGDSHWTHPDSQSQFPSNLIHDHPSPPENVLSFLNPDLSESEGQVGTTSVSRCLKVVSTVQSTRQCCLVVCNWRKRTGTRCSQRARKKQKRKQKNTPVPFLKQLPEQNTAASQRDEGDSKTKPLINEERLPTEEEIKANLRKKLEAFNQKVKLTSQLPHTSVTPPATSLASEMG